MVQSPGPLLGRTVMLTRARQQSAEMTRALESLGARVLHCPTIEIVEPEDWAPLDSCIRRLSLYDWIVFTSANGVSFFFRRAEDLGASLPDRIISLAIGPATAEALNKRGARVDLVAASSRAEGVLAAIAEHVGKEEALQGLRFLIPRARTARDFLPEELRRLGAEVDAVEAYRNVVPDVDRARLRSYFEQGEIDIITFTSSSTISNFAALTGERDLSTLLEGVMVACIGPVTAATAAEFGLHQVVQPATFNTEALVRAILAASGSES